MPAVRRSAILPQRKNSIGKATLEHLYSQAKGFFRALNRFGAELLSDIVTLNAIRQDSRYAKFWCAPLWIGFIDFIFPAAKAKRKSYVSRLALLSNCRCSLNFSADICFNLSSVAR
jgi:hypothetical protein